jgi:hypothetical protein
MSLRSETAGPPKAAASAIAPSEVFYVVETSGSARKRMHQTCSLLYETRPQAEAQRAQLTEANPGKIYSVWKHTSHIEPAVWLSDVVMADGSVVSAPR